MTIRIACVLVLLAGCDQVFSLDRPFDAPRADGADQIDGPADAHIPCDEWFRTRADYPSGVGPTAIIAAQLGGDSSIDLAVTSRSDDFVTIYLGTATGALGAGRKELAGDKPLSLVAADFTGDGNADLAVAVEPNVTLLVRSSGDDFVTASSVALGTANQSLLAVELSGDTFPELVAAVPDTNKVAVALGSAAGPQARTPISVGSLPASVAVGNFNGDAHNDLLVANKGSNTVETLVGDGIGGFVAGPTSGAGVQPQFIAVGRLNTDMRDDVAVVTADGVSVLFGTGTGTFMAQPTPVVVGSPRALAIADLDRDGPNDLVIAEAGETLAVFQNDGNGVFSRVASLPTAGNPVAVVVADLNHDGILDVASANFPGNTVTVFLGCR